MEREQNRSGTSGRKSWMMVLLGGCLLMVGMVSLSMGPMETSPSEVLGALMDRLSGGALSGEV